MGGVDRRTGADVEFEVTTHDRPEFGCVVVEVAGEVDQATRSLLATALDEAVASGVTVVLDLGRVRFFSAAGAHCLEDAANALQVRASALHLVCPETAPAWPVLNVLGLLRRWPPHQSVAEALRVATARSG